MVATVNASTSAGVVITPDNSGVLAFQSSSATALTIDASQNSTFVGTATATKLIPTGSSVTGNGLYLPAANSLGLSTNGTNAVYIDSSQNVGIGTASPSTYGKLVSYSGDIAAVKAHGSGSYPTLVLQNATAGTTFSGRILWKDGNGNAGWNVGQNVAVGSGYLEFNDGATNRMCIDTSGNIIIGNTSVSSINGGGGGSAFWNSGTNNIRRLQIGSNSTGSSQLTSWNTPNGEVGNITVSGVSTTYNTSSDYRLKENIAPMIGALAKVSQLKPCTFNWKWNGSDSQGFIAHELQAVVPECVTGEKDATHQEEYEVTPAVKNAQGNITTPAVMGTRTVPKYQSVDTSFLVATLTAAIQELKAINDTLTARIVALEGQ